jgi:thioesterase domain-containing protein/acyl carrier protein
LDVNLQPVPIGISGELHISGAGLARGYLNRPELNLEKFIQNPFSNNPQDRLYKTGDVVRYLPDGNIEFHGRQDDQVKIRGFRVELGEIENALRQHPDVSDVVVVAREESPSDRYLAAYITGQVGQTPRAKEIRNFLKDRLHNYMLPSTIIALDEFPVTTSGKVNREALPRPERERALAGSELVAPRDNLEVQLVQIWEDVLGISPLGVTDNFFELGGHSLMAVRLSVQVEKATGQKLSMATIFQAPNIEQQASILRQSGWLSPSSSMVQIRSGGSKHPFFCVPGNLGNVFTDLGYLARHMDSDRPFYAFQDGVQNPIRIENVASKYIDELRLIQPNGPYFLGGVCSGGVVAFEMAQQLRAQGERVSFLAMVEPSRPRSPSSRALFRFSQSIFRRLFERLRSRLNTYSKIGIRERRSYLRLVVKLLANEWAVLRYKPERYLGQLYIYLTHETMSLSNPGRDRWRDYVDGQVGLIEFPGTHDNVVGANGVKVEEAPMKALAERIKKVIDRS